MRKTFPLFSTVFGLSVIYQVTSVVALVDQIVTVILVRQWQTDELSNHVPSIFLKGHDVFQTIPNDDFLESSA